MTVLAIGVHLSVFYQNPNLDSKWREVKRASTTWKARERSVLRDLVISNNKDPLRACGRKWHNKGVTRPSQGKELTNPQLAEALSKTETSQIEFNSQEWEAFGIEDLQIDHFIKSPYKGTYAFYQPDVKGGVWEEKSKCDIDCAAPNYIICDGIDSKGRWMDKQPCNSLRTEIVRYLTQDMGLPAIAVKTGCAARCPIQDARKGTGTLGPAIDCLESGQQVLFLDLRDRKVPSASDISDRASLIESAKKIYTEHCENLKRTSKTVECFDTMTAAFWRDVLRGDASTQSRRELHFEPLCEAIQRCRARLHGASLASDPTVGIPPATVEQIKEVAWWVAKRSFEDDYYLLSQRDVSSPKQQQIEEELRARSGLEFGSDEFRDWWFWTLNGEKVNGLATLLEKLFQAEDFHACNVLSDLHNAKRLVSSLVKIDRLPADTPLEGLELLRQAWNEHDVAAYLGWWYTVWSNVFYLVYLALGISTVTLTVLHAKAEILNEAVETKSLSNAIFCLALASAFVLSVARLMNPTQRAMQLYSAAASMESITWRYRARICEFARSATNSLAPEHALREALLGWRETLTAGSDLDQTVFEKLHPEKVYRHYQSPCSEATKAVADAKNRHEEQTKLANDITDAEGDLHKALVERERGSQDKVETKGEEMDVGKAGGGGSRDGGLGEGRQATSGLTATSAIDVNALKTKLEELKNKQATFFSSITHMDDFQSPIKPGIYMLI